MNKVQQMSNPGKGENKLTEILESYFKFQMSNDIDELQILRNNPTFLQT